MRILLLGAGTVGHWVADMLCRRGHSVTVVDVDPERVRQINSELDVQAITGSASRSTVLFGAGVCGCDMCLAVTGSDEVNLVAASMAKALGARRVMARVYAPAFADTSTFDYQRHFGIDSLLSLEQLSAFELARSIRNPNAIPLEHFARGHLEVYELVVEASSPAASQRLKDLKLPPATRVGSIAREGRVWIASGEDELHAGDRISLIGSSTAVAKTRPMLVGRQAAEATQSILIAGGGETGYHLARALAQREYRISILEQNETRCSELAQVLPEATVIHANANRRSVLEEEGAGRVDFFVACTGSDESNIMAGVEARELGAKKVMCVVGRPDYANVVGKLGIDVVVSERNAAGRQITGFLNQGCVISFHELAAGSIGVYEIEIMENSMVAGTPLADLPLSGRCLIAAVHRDGYVRVPTAEDKLQAGDVIVALLDLSCKDVLLPLFEASS